MNEKDAFTHRDLDQAIEKVSEVNLMREIGLILIIVSIALRLISTTGYFIMGSVGVISLPSFLVTHEFLLTTMGFVIFLTGFFLAVVSYFLSKDENSDKAVLLGAFIGFVGSLLPPIDIFLIFGAIFIFLSLRRVK